MAARKKLTYHNLLEFSIKLDEDPAVAGNGDELFYALLIDYFFKEEAGDKGILGFLKNMDVPHIFTGKKSLRDITLDEIHEMVDAEIPNDTFAAKIMLSKKYLRTYFSHHEPDYKKMPTEVQMELIDRIKEKNDNIVYAFEKMYEDIERDRNRDLLTLIALVIKNVHIKSGFPMKQPKSPVKDLICKEYPECNQTFNADPQTMTNLKDDKKVKTLVKEFFRIKQHKDIVEVAGMIKKEFDRFEDRLKKTL